MDFKMFSDEDKLVYRSDIIEMLRESDCDFTPPLSARTSTLDSAFGTQCTEDGILSYYEAMNEQKIFGAFDGERLIAFVSFRENLVTKVISEDTLPNIYISTLVMRREARGRGITAITYDRLFNICYPDRSVFTRTWSTNAAHTRILCRFGFSELLRIENDRGEGIDTVYYAKPAKKKELSAV